MRVTILLVDGQAIPRVTLTFDCNADETGDDL
jgi:hypothetical protein